MQNLKIPFEPSNHAAYLDDASGEAAIYSAFLQALPIAAAFAKVRDNHLKIMAHNDEYRRKSIGHDKKMLVEHSFLLMLAHEAQASDTGRATRGWRSDNIAIRREFDVTASLCGSTEFSTLGRYLGEEHILLTFLDRTSEIESQNQLRREMVVDSLTGLPNRIGFEEQIDARIDALEQQNSYAINAKKFAVFSVDMARFSQINECAGAVVGDELLTTVARRLIGQIRKRDILARTDSNEFAIYAEMPRGEADVPRVSRRILEAFSMPFRLSDMEIQIEVAIGVAIGTVGRRNGCDAIRDAQMALKKSKRTQSLEIYSPESLDIARRRFSLETELRKALQNNHLELYYQPLVGFSNSQIMGFEALARWKDPDRGFISPGEFIPVAEDCGLIVPLGRWAFEEACETLKRWDVQVGEVLPLKLNINVSAVQFARDDIPKMVAQTLRSSKVGADRITLELTESVVVSDPDRARKVMQALRQMNISLAMDDFGTGYSNLAYLQQLPIDVLKIDRSFVTSMLEDKDKVAIVRAILSLATALGMETTAEGIESLELFNTLAALGCTYGQGYYMAAPLPAKEALALYLNARNSTKNFAA